MKPKPLNVRLQALLLAAGVHGIDVAREPANRKLLQEVYRADPFGLWREAYTELRAYSMSDDEINQIVAPIYSEPPPASSPDDFGTGKVVPIKTTKANGAARKSNGHANGAEAHQGLPRKKDNSKRDAKVTTDGPIVVIPSVIAPSIWPNRDKGGEPKRTYRNARFAIVALA
jgi:hypothetical protein